MAKIKLDKERTLRFDLNAMEIFEETAGVRLSDKEALENLSSKNIKILLWACLIDDDPELTLKQLGRLITTDNLDMAAEALKNMMEGKGETTPL